MRVIIFALLIAAVVVANIDTVSSFPTEAAITGEQIQTTERISDSTKDPRLADNRKERAKICEPGTKYEIWGTKCVCTSDGKDLDCEGIE